MANQTQAVTRNDVEEIVSRVVGDVVGEIINDVLVLISERFEAVDKRFEQIDKRFDKQDNQIAELFTITTRIENKLDATADLVDEHSWAIRQLQQKVA